MAAAVRCGARGPRRAAAGRFGGGGRGGGGGAVNRGWLSACHGEIRAGADANEASALQTTAMLRAGSSGSAHRVGVRPRKRRIEAVRVRPAS
eukprot:1188544-Prymnesium_polylepis.1